MGSIWSRWARRSEVRTQKELAELEIESLNDQIKRYKSQMEQQQEAHALVIHGYKEALRLNDHVVSRYVIAEDRQQIEKDPLPVKIEGMGEVSDILMQLVQDSEFEVPFLGRKGKGAILGVIKKNKGLIDEKAGEVIGNIVQNMSKEEFGKAKDEYSAKVKEQGR